MEKTAFPVLILRKHSKIVDGRYSPHGFQSAGHWEISRIPKGANLGCALLRWVDPNEYTVVLDEDPRNGGDATFLEGLGAWVTRTASGGRHFWFTTPLPHEEFRATYKGIDVKHLERGYVVLAGSVVDYGDGELKSYHWEVPPVKRPPRLPAHLMEFFGDQEDDASVSTEGAPRVRTSKGVAPDHLVPPRVLERIFRAARLVPDGERFDAKGRIHLVCPNAEQHTTASLSSTSLLPTADGDGTFRCLHSHCTWLNSRRSVLRYLFAKFPQVRASVRRDDPLWLRRLTRHAPPSGSR